CIYQRQQSVGNISHGRYNNKGACRLAAIADNANRLLNKVFILERCAAEFQDMFCRMVHYKDGTVAVGISSKKGLIMLFSRSNSIRKASWPCFDRSMR